MKVSFFQLVYLSALSMLGFIATDMYLPAFKMMETAFATGPEQIALSLTVFLVGMALGQLLWGLASDKFGHRNTLIAGLLVLPSPLPDSRLAQRYGNCYCCVLSKRLGCARLR